jgi:hypothetical protein
MIQKIEPENQEKGNYRVVRPFVYQEVEYFKDEAIEADGDDLKFLLRNNLIK